MAALLAGLLAQGGIVSLAESVPRYTQRLYALLELGSLGPALSEKVRAAEEAIYAAADDPLVNWTERDLENAFKAAGLSDVRVDLEQTMAETVVTPAMLARWFGPTASGGRPSYRQRLAAALTPEELAAVQSLYERQLTNRPVQWRSVTAYLVAR